MSSDEAGATRVEDLDGSLPDLQDTSATVALVEERLAETAVAVDRREMIGSPAATINWTATAVDADAILLGVRKRSPVEKAVFGSVSQQVILGADRPAIIADRVESGPVQRNREPDSIEPERTACVPSASA